MTDEEIEAAYEVIKARKKEEERQRWYASSMAYAENLIGKPVSFEVDLYDKSLQDDYSYDSRNRSSYKIDEFLDRLPAGCRIRVTAEVIKP
jgi:hypothetical protein